MEARIAKLEAAAEFTSKRLDGIEKRIDRVDADLRMMLGGLVGGFLLLAGMLIAGYLKLDERFVRAEGRVTSLEASLAKQDAKLDAILSRIPAQPTIQPRK